MTVYLDVIWILNLLFDTLLLYLTGIVLKRETRFLRVLLGGFIGSTLILFSISPIHVIASHPLVKFMISLLMILVTFGYRRFQFFWQSLITFYLISFGIGGMLIGIHYFIQSDSSLATSTALKTVRGFGDPISWVLILIGFPLAWSFSKSTLNRLEYTKVKYEQLVNITIVIDDFHVMMKGLIDSGNQVKDPLTGKPVIFASIEHVQDVPDSIRRLAEGTEYFFHEQTPDPLPWQERISVIPYKVYGQEHQMVLGIRPDKVLIEKEKVRFSVEKCLVVFTMQKLSSDGEFQCILHPKLFVHQKESRTWVS